MWGCSQGNPAGSFLGTCQCGRCSRKGSHHGNTPPEGLGSPMPGATEGREGANTTRPAFVGDCGLEANTHSLPGCSIRPANASDAFSGQGTGPRAGQAMGLGPTCPGPTDVSTQTHQAPQPLPPDQTLLQTSGPRSFPPLDGSIFASLSPCRQSWGVGAIRSRPCPHRPLLRPIYHQPHGCRLLPLFDALSPTCQHPFKPYFSLVSPPPSALWLPTEDGHRQPGFPTPPPCRRPLPRQEHLFPSHGFVGPPTW